MHACTRVEMNTFDDRCVSDAHVTMAENVSHPPHFTPDAISLCVLPQHYRDAFKGKMFDEEMAAHDFEAFLSNDDGTPVTVTARLLIRDEVRLVVFIRQRASVTCSVGAVRTRRHVRGRHVRSMGDARRRVAERYVRSVNAVHFGD